jgi:hypothetical protein
MGKLHPDSITQSDIEDYLNNYADFSFELRVLKEFLDLGLQCSHSGTYDDPITGKSREFDVRALLQQELIRIHLSVECKNIKDNFPLVVHSLKRKGDERYNELIFTFSPQTRSSFPRIPKGSMDSSSTRVRVSPQFSLYSKDDYVAKSADQVGRRQHDESITATDGGVFEKISQAINSATSLIYEAHCLNVSRIPHPYFTFVCPVLVIPDSMLWQVKYSDDGARIGTPEQINHISYYIGKEWTVGNQIQDLTYTISHLEIVTFSEIRLFIEKYLRKYVDDCSAIVSRGGDFF